MLSVVQCVVQCVVLLYGCVCVCSSSSSSSAIRSAGGHRNMRRMSIRVWRDLPFHISSIDSYPTQPTNPPIPSSTHTNTPQAHSSLFTIT